MWEDLPEHRRRDTARIPGKSLRVLLRASYLSVRLSDNKKNNENQLSICYTFSLLRQWHLLTHLILLNENWSSVRSNNIGHTVSWASLVSQMVESACNVGDLVSIPQSGRFPGGGNGNPLQYSCLENPMDRGVWQATTVHGSQRVRHDWATNTSKWRDSPCFMDETTEHLKTSINSLISL